MTAGQPTPDRARTGRQPPHRPPHTRIGRRAGTVLGVVAAGVLAASVLSLAPVEQVAYHPGPLYDTLGAVGETGVLEIDPELETYPTDGNLYFTTIRLSGGPGDALTGWDWLRAQIDPATTLVPRSQVFPDDVTAEQVREQNTSLMQHSQEDAAVVALRASGIEVPEQVVVAQVIADAPADGVLRVDDVIVGVDGDEMSSATDVQERLQEVAAGDSVPMTLVRDDEESTIDVPTREDEESGRTIVGVYLAPRYDMPYEVSFDAGNVGGPSAGLMFSLAVYDTITPGPLTDGRAVAGTGTITGAGDVGGIGGIPQKMYAADENDVELFLAPAANCNEVVGATPDDLTVVPVSTFEDALSALEAAEGVEDLGSAELPSCQEVLDGASG